MVAYITVSAVCDTCRVQTCRLADLQTADLQTCRLADLQTCRLLWRRQTMWHWITRLCHAQNVIDPSAKMDGSGELNAPINVKPAGGGGVGRRGIGRDFDRSLWPWGRAFELSCCPGGKDIWIFVRARYHKSFPGQGISVTMYIWPHIFALG